MYKIGDSVYVIYKGRQYSSYTDMAEAMGVSESWVKYDLFDNGDVGFIVGVKEHLTASNKTILYGVMKESGQVYLIDGSGIKKITMEAFKMNDVIGIGALSVDFGGFKNEEIVDIVKEGTNVVLCKKKSDGSLLTIPKKLFTRLDIKAPTVSASLSGAEESVLGDILGKGVVEFESVVPAEPEPPRPTLKKNQIWFTDVTGGRLPTSKIDHIIDVYGEEHFPLDIRCDIPEGDKDYYWDTDILELLVLGYQLNKKVLITGLPGTGKSSAIKQFASIIRQPYMRFNGKDGVEPSSFLGYPWAGKEGMEWKDGLLPTGCKRGYLVTIDEVFKLNAGVQMAMQCLYEDGGHLLLDDKPGTLGEKRVIPVDEFRLFMTDNVKGTGDNLDMFAATQMQDTSTLDRFALVGELGYLQKQQEEDLLKRKYPKMKKDLLKKMVSVADLIRNGYRKGQISVTLSPRGLFTICELSGKGIDIKTAMTYSFTNKLGEDDEKLAVDQIFKTVGV